MEDGGSRKENRAELLRAFTLPAVIGLVVLGIAGVNFANSLADREAVATPSLASCEVPVRSELAPASGSLFGVNLDWHSKSLASFAKDLGHKPAVSVSFTGFPLTSKDEDDLQRAVEQIHADGHMMLLTLEPAGGLDAVTEDAASALAKDLAHFNNEGVPVIIRFAHEMNGSWYAWSQQPQKYVAAFQTLANAVHRDAPGSAMMWAPNYGGGYPFAGGQFEAKPGTPEFAALDTNGDGVVTMNDDAYSPYYPGDEAVDWVGMSLYHWGSKYPWGENEAWWKQLFSPATHQQFPLLKMINWFEWDKDEIEVKGRVDWTVTNTPAVREAFTAALPEWFQYGPDKTCQPKT
ncbi:glycosyl hydrolase [Paenarthrobacter nitroguajacolicus]|uniref:glycosyl hydrolase n=1 Tax=Paenarthrobacter nitroguajacolicus TaxID=211146 RepID=UPI00285FA18D|nr:glycosyl hydrolase [Paenarthrobacter nitroguajacolicus]MDR6640048.1 hypothetical protein [Paenarthrobacter nitroguajacolicus]